jgi:beta-xylosidase
MEVRMEQINPIIRADYPDPEVIRVDDTYYMISTTMHFLPGGVILRSYDLVHWEFVSYVFERLDSTDEECLRGEQSIYGRGMWAASLRHHEGKFYVCFTTFETGKTYIYIADKITGPWEKHGIEGARHHSSLLFDDDGRIYIVWGMNQIRLEELKKDFSGIKEDGYQRILAEEQEEAYLGYEGSHFYKIDGRYYLFAIHWPKRGNHRRTQVCLWADSIDGEFTGEDVFDDDIGYHNQGVAQGGIVDTPEGKWYAVMYQDRGAVGRLPVLIPVVWKNRLPVFGDGGKAPETIVVKSTRPDYRYEPLLSSRIFADGAGSGQRAELHPAWQWNHEPNDALWRRTDDGGLGITTGKISVNLIHAVNTLTQRMAYPESTACVRMDVSGIRNGDCAGLCALQGCYGWIGITKDLGRYFLVMYSRDVNDSSGRDVTPDYMPGNEVYRIPFEENCVELKIHADFTDMRDTAEFFYRRNGKWVKAGEQKLYFKLDHFMGCRYGMFLYSTRETGGEAVFWNFRYHV